MTESFYEGILPTQRHLRGRDQQLAWLDQAVDNLTVRVVVLEAKGGVGKSSIASEWLYRLRERERSVGAHPVFAWSFYSQGTRGDFVTVDPFLGAAIEWAGGDEVVKTWEPTTKGTQVAHLLASMRPILVLDGMEPLQAGEPMENRGMLKHPAMRSMLRSLVESDWDGLCVITTRVPVLQLASSAVAPTEKGAVWVHELPNLEPKDGAAVLHDIGVRAGAEDGEGENESDPFKPLRGISETVHGHPLTLKLIGQALKWKYGGDSRHAAKVLGASIGDLGRDRDDPSDVRYFVRSLDELRGERPAALRHTLSFFVHCFDEQANDQDATPGSRMEAKAALTLIHLMGLFDRPATRGALDALVSNHGLVYRRLNGGIQNIGDEVVGRTIATLVNHGLLLISTWNTDTDQHSRGERTLDAHPLIREEFQDRLQFRLRPAWRQGNRVLMRYHAQRPKNYCAQSQDEALELYTALAYGCRAGLFQEVHDDILVERISQWETRGAGMREAHLATRKLGLRDSHLSAMSQFFPSGWDAPVPQLDEHSTTKLVTNVGVAFRQLGQLNQAIGLFEHSVNLAQESTPPDWVEAAYASSQRSELQLIVGRLEESRDSARAAVKFAEKIQEGNSYFAMHAHSGLADAYFFLGDRDLAAKHFKQALWIHDHKNPDPHFFYSQSLFRYVYFLFDSVVRERGPDNSSLDTLESWLEDPKFGLRVKSPSDLSLPIAALARGVCFQARARRRDGSPSVVDLENALKELDYAIDKFDDAAYTDYLVRGLYEIISCHLLRGDEPSARVALDRAIAIVEPSSPDAIPEMDTLRADLYLQRAELAARFGGDDLQDAVDAAGELVSSLGYKRRQSQLDRLRQISEGQGE